jgi:hypothetical protein
MKGLESGITYVVDHNYNADFQYVGAYGLCRTCAVRSLFLSLADALSATKWDPVKIIH